MYNLNLEAYPVRSKFVLVSISHRGSSGWNTKYFSIQYKCQSFSPNVGCPAAGPRRGKADRCRQLSLCYHSSNTIPLFNYFNLHCKCAHLSLQSSTLIYAPNPQPSPCPHLQRQSNMAPTYEYTERFGPQLCQKGVKFKPTPHGPFESKRDMIYTKTFYYCLWWPLSRPYYVPVGIKDWWKKEHSEPRLSEKAFHKQRTTDKPRKLPTKRKRELSLPRKASRLPWKNVPKTTDFLTKLPYDIRYMIWELVIPQREVSIFHGKRRLVHLLHRGKRMKINARKQTNNLLAVMKTCRLM